MNSKNTRKTLIGTFIGMMALTAASAATAGVAWFTTTRTANVTFQSASVSSNRGELKVGALGETPDLATYAANDTNPAFKSKMDAISSYDGVNFYNALLDVDGSELGIFLKDEDPTVAEFGFSAGTQNNADTDLTVYLEKMDIKVSDVKSESFEGDGATKDFVIAGTPVAGDVPVVKLNGVVQDSGYSYVENTKTVTFTTAPAKDDPSTEDQNELQTVTIEYRYEVADDDPILNSIRVALFASNEEDAIADIAVEENQTLVWDTTHANSEVHNGITVTAKAATHADEKHVIRKASEKFIDLKYAPESQNDITSIMLHREGVDQDADLSSMITLSGRRVTTTYEVKRGDVITVTYKADTIGEKALANVDEKIDGYYAGKDLVDEYGGHPETDGDLTLYGAYLGETKGNDPLNVVVRAWIEGTDADHDQEGSGWHPTSEDSIDISGHSYKVAFDLGLAAIDVNIA